MKRIALMVGLVILVLGLAVLAQTQTENWEHAEQELIALEKSWSDAMVKKDLAFLDQILSDDYLFTDPDGAVSTKAQLLAYHRSGESIYASVVTDNVKVRIYGDAAVVIGRNTERYQNKGKDISGQYQWTDTWVKHAGRWRCVAGHVSKIAQK
jgi:ketosteroid isomerase-like protein